jgi:hypothetical protein
MVAWLGVSRSAAVLVVAISLQSRAQEAAESSKPADSEASDAAAKKEDDATALAKKVQNPVADLYSFPFQDNIGFNYGPNQAVQNVLNFQPVIPIHLGPDVNLITRTILPIVTQPVSGGSTTGLGNVSFSAFLSPAKGGKQLIWGVGPVVTFPTATSPDLGSQSTWGLGASVVALSMQGPWVFGVLVNNVWSVAGASSNTMLIQPFINYNLKDGWFINTSPTIYVNWEAADNNKWLVPFGGGFGKLQFFGKVPINFNAQVFWNGVHPDTLPYPSTTLRLQATLIL